jgi:protein TonB
MLAYAANMPRTAQRAGSPKALTLIIAGHALVLAAVLTARMQTAIIPPPGHTTLVNIKEEPPPKPEPQKRPDPRRPVTQHPFSQPERPIVDMEQPTAIQFDPGQTIADIGTVIGSGPTAVSDPPKHAPVMVGPRLATSESALKPPYPLDMRRLEKEATLRLKLTIDARGRVTAVDPVGAADPSFLEAARRHILKAWRYRPATEGGVAVPSSTLISLSFRLEDV